MSLGLARYDDDDAYYVVNHADRVAALNGVEDSPEIIKELRAATIGIILRRARTEGEQVVKVQLGSKPPTAAIMGYATFLRFIAGCDLAALEAKLGFRAGVLRECGARLYRVDPLALNASNLAPRGNTDWSAGVSPRDLHNVSVKADVPVEYHRDYPAASKPIIQFAILYPVPFLGSPRFLEPGDSV